MAIDNGETHEPPSGRRPLLRPSTRLRTGIFLAINLASFIAVNAFWQYLATGRWINFTLGAYHHAMVTPLGEMLIHPLNVLSYPWMILVTGLLLGLVIMVPLVVAVLYRLIFAAVFVLAVAAVGHAPVLALALAAGCVLAARTPLRSEMPLLATMVGMLPIAVYLYFFAFAGVDPLAALPLQKWVLYAPFVVAGVCVVVASAIVLLLAKLTGFRPGVVWPVLAALLAAPMGIFYSNIGPAELNYGVLVYGLAPGDAVFDPVALDVWKRRHGAEDLQPSDLKERIRKHLQDQCDELVARCDEFLEKYPESKRAPAAQWLKAQCLSLQFDTRAMHRKLVKYSAGHYLSGSWEAWKRSAPAWKQLRSSYRGSRQAALADWRLGELDLVNGNFREGHHQLRRAAGRLREFAPTFSSDIDNGEPKSIFSTPESVPDRRHYVQAFNEVERLIQLVEDNRILVDANSLPTREDRDKLIGSKEALRAYLKSCPDDYERLKSLEETTYRDTWMADNLALARARAAGDLDEKVRTLLACASRSGTDASSDAAVAARFDLGLLAMSPKEIEGLDEELKDELERKTPEEYFQAVVNADKQPWKRLAQESLAKLRRTSRP
ncbi:MAG: hypothetical protein ACYTF6_08435 [Planctomycetota bacterium]|jgi:hypothetical protein